MLENISITDKEFNLISALVYNKVGINLTEQKRAMVAGRLRKSMQRSGFSGFGEYYENVVNDKTGRELSNLVNCISTNHTFFYREEKHFEFFQNVALPNVVDYLRKQGSRDLRIWCAGCSSGEEAYVLTMLLLDFFGKEYGLWDAGLLATDISGRVLDIARQGIYATDRLNSLPQKYLNKYFARMPDGNYSVIDRVKKEIVFRRFNLMNDVFPFKESFHIIFCRNVMIYFDRPSRENLIEKFHRLMVPGGYLVIGHSESLGRDQNLFRYLHPAVYRKI